MNKRLQQLLDGRATASHSDLQELCRLQGLEIERLNRMPDANFRAFASASAEVELMQREIERLGKEIDSLTVVHESVVKDLHDDLRRFQRQMAVMRSMGGE